MIKADGVVVSLTADLKRDNRLVTFERVIVTMS